MKKTSSSEHNSEIAAFAPDESAVYDIRHLVSYRGDGFLPYHTVAC